MSMTPPSVLCLIPARAGSKRIRGKNIKMFGGKPLVAHTILQARKVKFVDRIIVDTDSPAIATLAKKYGAEVPFLRPKRLAGEWVQVIDSTAHLLARLKKETRLIRYMVSNAQNFNPEPRKPSNKIRRVPETKASDIKEIDKKLEEILGE